MGELTKKEKLSKAISDVMVKLAERDQCPVCQRKSAITKKVIDYNGKPLGFQCRYCQYTSWVNPPLPEGRGFH